MATITRPEMPILRESADEIYQRIVNRMTALAERRGETPPATEEGELFYDLLFPIADEISEQQILLEYAFMQAFLPWADGEFLDAHGYLIGVPRNDGEEDERYRVRLIEKAAEEEGNGSVYDYSRWSKEVAGVGEVFVWGEPPNTVHIAITDSAGSPADEQLVTAVTEHLKRPDKHSLNDEVLVRAAQVMPITISGTVELEAGTTLEHVIPLIEEGIRAYLRRESKRILYSYIERQFNVPGVLDYRDVQVNGGTDNIELDFGTIPVLGDVTVNTI